MHSLWMSSECVTAAGDTLSLLRAVFAMTYQLSCAVIVSFNWRNQRMRHSSFQNTWATHTYAHLYYSRATPTAAGKWSNIDSKSFQNGSQNRSWDGFRGVWRGLGAVLGSSWSHLATKLRKSRKMFESWPPFGFHVGLQNHPFSCQNLNKRWTK